MTQCNMALPKMISTQQQLLLLLLFCLSLFWVGESHAYTFVLSKDKIQEKLEKKFPITKQKSFFWIKLCHPKSLLKPQENQMGLALDLRYQLLEKVVKTGNITLLGTPKYDAKTGEFYLHNVRVSEFQLQNARPDQTYLLGKFLEKIAAKKFQRVTLYTLKSDRLRDQLIKSFIRNIQVKQDEVVITLELSKE